MSDPSEQLGRMQLDRSYPKQSYRFWETQPVAQFQHKHEDIKEGPIEDPKTPEDVRKDPYPLHEQFEWCLCDLQDEDVISEVFDLLRLNYVEDEDEMFRFCYSKDFLTWALCPPGHKKEWHVGVRVTGNKKLVSFITGIPASIVVNGETIPSAEINFLCIHKKLRSKRLAPLLIKEITRRINLCNVWQAVYTAGVVLPKPVATCRYWHRSINPRKLVEVGFSHLTERNTMSRLVRLNRLPDEPTTPGFREITDKDYPKVTQLLNEYLSKYKVHQHFQEDEVRHFLTPKDSLVYVYVVENESGEITDLASFYCLPSSILNHKDYKELRAAYMYYTASKATNMRQLLNDAMVKARDNNFDVFNALDILENSRELLTDLKFGIGDGNLHYYLFNWRVHQHLQPSDIGLILM